MKVGEIDAINYKNNEAVEAKEKVVLDETITLTINNDISRSLSAIEDSLLPVLIYSVIKHVMKASPAAMVSIAST